MNDFIKSADLGELERCLKSLKISVGKSAETGFFIAYTTSEPLFCYERRTEEELQAVVVDTLKSYVESFYAVEGAEIRVVTENAPPPIPIRHVHPSSFLRPFLAPLHGRSEEDLALA